MFLMGFPGRPRLRTQLGCAITPEGGECFLPRNSRVFERAGPGSFVVDFKPQFRVLGSQIWSPLQIYGLGFLQAYEPYLYPFLRRPSS